MPISLRIIQLIISVQAASFQRQTKAGIKKEGRNPSVWGKNTEEA